MRRLNNCMTIYNKHGGIDRLYVTCVVKPHTVLKLQREGIATSGSIVHKRKKRREKMEAIELPKMLPMAQTITCTTPQSIGLDLYSPTNIIIPLHDKVLINTGMAFKIPMGYYGHIALLSWMVLHHHIHVGAGVINPDYIGSVQVLLLNFGSQNHLVEANNRIAQLVLEKIAYPILCQILSLPNMEHGPQGFGSTGE